MSDVRLWRITALQTSRLDTGAATLDEVTRQLPDGYYSTFRTFDGGTRVLGLRSHLRRLYDPVSHPDVDKSLLRQQLFSLLELYRPGEARVRAIMTEQGQVYIALAPLALLPREVYENGVHAETTALQRQHPRLKSTTFIVRSDAERKHIAEEGIFEALLVKDGRILEGMTSNFFYVSQMDDLSTGRQAQLSAQRQEILGTARDDILLGITRATVIDLARQRGWDVMYQPLSFSELDSIHEAFITSSSRGIVPVVQIDRVTIGQGRPGKITRELMSAYEAYVQEHAESILSSG